MIENKLKAILEKTFNCDHLIVKNESHLHEGHSGSPGTGESHFSIIIVSRDFEGQGRVACHRMVNEAVNPLFSEGLHALSLKTYTPDTFQKLN